MVFYLPRLFPPGVRNERAPPRVQPSLCAALIMDRPEFEDAIDNHEKEGKSSE